MQCRSRRQHWKKTTSQKENKRVAKKPDGCPASGIEGGLKDDRVQQ
jgi:hypothetical protein